MLPCLGLSHSQVSNRFNGFDNPKLTTFALTNNETIQDDFSQRNMECSQQKSFSFSLFRFHRFIVLQAKLTGTAASACASFFDGQKRDDMTTEKGGTKTVNFLSSTINVLFRECSTLVQEDCSLCIMFLSLLLLSLCLSSLKRVTFCYTKVPKHVLLGNWDGKSLQIRFRLHQQPICMNALFVC